MHRQAQRACQARMPKTFATVCAISLNSGRRRCGGQVVRKKKPANRPKQGVFLVFSTTNENCQSPDFCIGAFCLQCRNRVRLSMRSYCLRM